MKRVWVGLAVVVMGGAAWAGRGPAKGEVEAPYPDIHADTSPEGVARGQVIFDSVCQECHRPAGGERVSGKHITEIPSFLGEFYASNLTAHPTAGIGGATDAELARVIRYGVSRDGRMTIMPQALADSDVAAVLGFLRSGDSRLGPDPTVQKPTRLSFIGGLVMRLMGRAQPPQRPAAGIPVPPREDTLAFGRYTAMAFHCSECHTPGFDADKVAREDALAGGDPMPGPDGRPRTPPNLTRHMDGLGAWTEVQFATALREGMRPDGQPLSHPMPRFRGLTEVEVHALYAFLRSLPPRPGHPTRPLPPSAVVARAAEGTPAYVPDARAAAALGRTAQAAAAVSTAPAPAPLDGARLFEKHGCGTCHGPGAVFHDRLAAAKGKDVEQVAQWIRTPQAFKPGTQMPGYGNFMSEEEARVLARWVLDVGPGSGASAPVNGARAAR